MNENELNNQINLLGIELNKAIDMAEFDLSNETVIEKSEKLDRYLLEHQERLYKLSD